MKNKKIIFSCAFLCAAGLCTAGFTLPDSTLNIVSVVQADDAVYKGFLYTVKDGEATITGYSEDLDLSNVVIPDVIAEGDAEFPVTAIGENAFYRSDAASIKVSDNVRSIGDSAFERCDKLKTLDLGKNVKFLGNHAIASYSDGLLTTTHITLETLILPDDLKSVGNDIFTNGPSVTTINNLVIPASVQNIPAQFYGASNLISVEVDEKNEVYSSSNGILYNKDATELIRCPQATELKMYDIDSAAVSISDGAFEGTGIQNLLIPPSVTEIGSNAFKKSSLNIIRGAAGSYAETFAAENQYTFEAVEIESVPTAVPSKIPSTLDGPQTPPTQTPSAEPTALPSTAPSPSVPVSCDLNDDGKTTTTDVKCILKRIVGKITFTEAQEKAADINGDGVVNTSDALHLLRKVALSGE